MKRLFQLSISLFLLTLVFLPSISLVSAADIRGDDRISITNPEEILNNPYLFGEKVEVTVPVQNDLVTGGNELTLESSVSGSIWAAGGEIEINSEVGNSIRVAGGEITIDSQVNEDLIVFGGTVNVTENASIGGDLIFFGGQLQVDGPVEGDIKANGGEITLNSTVGGNVEGEMGELTLGSNGRINGNLSYSAENEGDISSDKVAGEITFSETNRAEEAKDDVAGLITAGTIYKLVADAIFVLLFIWLLRPFVSRVIKAMDSTYLKSTGLGFATLILTPLASLFLLVIVWVGMSLFLLYGLLLLISLALMKLFIGWKVLSWWEGRNDKTYVLDWKAAILGVLLVFILGLIPVLGWLVVFLLFLLSLGGLTTEIFSSLSTQRGTKLSPSKSKK